MATDGWLVRLREQLARPVDPAGVAFVRFAFGSVLAFSAIRFWAKGWIDELYLEPSYHFAYPGFEWVSAHPPWGLHAHFAVMVIAALLFAFGIAYRASALVLFLTFTWVELIDQSYYLNHYYLVSLVLALACVLPLHRRDTVPLAAPLLLRAQLAIVYFYAGVAKLDADWLLRAEPLRTWLFAHSDVPVIGPLLQPAWVAFALAWAGALFDLSIALLLCLPKARLPAYLAVVGFHVATGLLFPIGVFPLVMIALTTVFFPHDWPRTLLERFGRPRAARRTITAAPPLSTPVTVALTLYLALQALIPLRHFAYPGAVNWTEEGFRFAWRVMLIEKTGHVELRVVDRATGQRFTIDPRAELSPRQVAIMSTQPAMIVQYARHVADRFTQRGHRDVAVYADAFGSLNGRRTQRLIDPDYDLAAPRSALATHPAITQLGDSD
jgi:vitamin K-dependent gamma-carboxylase